MLQIDQTLSPNSALLAFNVIQGRFFSQSLPLGTRRPQGLKPRDLKTFVSEFVLHAPAPALPLSRDLTDSSSLTVGISCGFLQILPFHTNIILRKIYTIVNCTFFRWTIGKNPKIYDVSYLHLLLMIGCFLTLVLMFIILT